MSRVNPLKKLLPIQILAIGAFVLSLTASLFNIFADNSLIYPNFSSTFKMSITVVNIFTTLISLIIFFFPKLHFLLYIGLISQSIFCVMLGYIGLGVFLFTLFVILFYILTSFTEKTQKICLTLFFIAYSFVLFFILCVNLRLNLNGKSEQVDKSCGIRLIINVILTEGCDLLGVK